jgi:hypothetical protein
MEIVSVAFGGTFSIAGVKEENGQNLARVHII